MRVMSRTKDSREDASKQGCQGQVYAHGIGQHGQGVCLHPPLPLLGHTLGHAPGLGAGLHDLRPGLVLVKGATGVAAPPVIDVSHQLQPMSTNSDEFSVPVSQHIYSQNSCKNNNGLGRLFAR